MYLPQGRQVDFESSVSNTTVGWILICIGIITAVLGIGHWWLTTQYKAYAGLSGVDAVLDLE
jgi:uncharacterized membrane protein YidH (DUF202 family)